jgi:outer membrane protein TolC
MAMKVLRMWFKNFVLVSLWALILLGGVFLTLSGAAPPEKDPGAKDLSCGGAMDFDTCARLALRQSPFLTRSDLEIQVRRLYESDSKADFVPSLNFRTRYYLSDLSQAGSGSSPSSLEFISDPYSPVEAYFTLQVRKLITRIAILNHLKVIAEGLQRLGGMFLKMDAMTQVAQVQTKLIQLAEKNLAYTQERQKTGQGTALEIKVAAQELEVVRLNQRQLLEDQRKIKESIRAYLAWPANQELRFDLPPSRPQILGNTETLSQSVEAMPSSSFDLKIQAIKKELQQYNITLAKTKLLPTLFMGAQTPDPLTLVQSRSFFFFVGANIPVWDGFKRLRNVSRQKTILKQYDAETNEKEIDFKEKWRAAQENLTDAVTHLKISQSQLDLAILREKQQEVRYHSLGEPFSVYLEGAKGVFEARNNVIMKTLEYDQAKLNLRHLANDLVSRYVDENSLPKRSEERY